MFGIQLIYMTRLHTKYFVADNQYNIANMCYCFVNTDILVNTLVILGRLRNRKLLKTNILHFTT